MIPPAPTSDMVFSPPPGWTAPAGFDPRRGHLVDPAWPAAPEGWQFWAPAPRAAGAAAAIRRGWWGPVVLGLGMLVLVLVLVNGGGTGSAFKTEGVGSCWASGTGGRYEAVACDSSRAQYVVDVVTDTPAACPATAVGYFDDTDVVECLAPAP